MKIERTAQGQFAIVQGSQRLVLERTQYEDIFYAVPLENASLYRLLNDTILGTDALRTVFRSIVAEAGGSEKAMAALQEAVKGVDPA
ncbi:MAG: hypothetical protein FD180_2907 [Planctomycetota bacterium]|nr:MAG: hypothetical protein FD180_2907 [Planctomycetota bacterium]